MLITQQNFLEQLEFDEKKHRYKYNGKIFPSVTQIVDSFQSKNRFNDWYINLGNNYAKENNQVLSKEEALVVGKSIGTTIRNEVGKNGTKVHKILENYYLGKGTEKELGRFLPCVKLFNVEKTEKDLPCVEHRIFYKNEDYCYAGTLDALMVTKQETKYWGKDERIIVDYKNPRKAKQPIMTRRDGSQYYPLLSYGLQLSAYNEGLNFLYNEKIDKALIISAAQDRKNLTYYFFNKEDLTYLFSNFLEMLKAYVDHKPYTWELFEQEASMLNHIGQKIVI